jgi:hypothetical protein
MEPSGMNTPDIITESFAKLAHLGCLVGAAPITQFDGCWEYRLDEQWEIAMNGHKEPRKCSFGVEVAPFHCYLQYNGWPAGVFNPRGGTIAAGSCANEDTFIAAIDAAIAKHTVPA